MTEESIVFYGNRVADIRIQDTLVNTLQARMGTGGGNMPLVCYPIDTKNALRNADKKDVMNRQGLGLGNDGDPSPTITDVFVPGVAYPIADGRELNNKNQNGTGVGQEGDPMFTINTVDHHAVAFTQNQRDEAVHQATSIVRRLTPTECERLQGFPDGWTEGQADTHRYKQMGNAVAVPVVEWIMERLVANDKRNKSDVV